MFVVAAIAGLAAVVFSSAAPTNTALIDGVERFVAVAAVTVAASRARRWTLVLGAALVTAGSAFPVLLVGAVALGSTLFMVETRHRSRWLGSLVGAVIGLLSLQLEVPGPTGVETVLGLAATVPLLYSGYRRSTRDIRKQIRRGLVVLVAVLVTVVLVTAVAAAASVSDLESAIESTEDGVDLAREGQGDESSEAFSEANKDFSSARSKIGSWWAGASRVVPIYGANLTAVQRTVRAGADLSEGATSLVSGAEFEDVQLEGGGVDLVALDDLAPKVRTASSTLARAGDLLATTDSTWLVPPLRDRLIELEDRLEETRQSSQSAEVAVAGLPAVLGSDGQRRYLFLLGNPAESRDMGGHIGNWAEVVVEGGRLDLVDVGGPLELASTEPGSSVVGSYPDSLMSMDPVRYPQNLGATPDLPTSARLAAEMYEQQTERPVDGVAYADPYAFASFLELVGPVPVPGLDGFELDAANAVEFLTAGQFTMFPSENESSDALESVIETVFERLVSTKLPGPQTLADLFGPLVHAGRFQFASLHPDDEDMLDYFDLSGEVPAPDGGDVLGVFNRNAGPSKIDAFLEREVSARIRWDPDSGVVNSVVTVDLTNNAPPGGINRVVGGNAAGVEPGTNLTDLVVLTPFALDAVLVDGVRTAASPLLEDGLWRHTVRIGLPPGGTTSVNFHLLGDVSTGDHYGLQYVGQPLVNPGGVSVTLEPARGRIDEFGSDEVQSMASVEFNQDGDHSIDWVLEGRT